MPFSHINDIKKGKQHNNKVKYICYLDKKDTSDLHIYKNTPNFAVAIPLGAYTP